VIFHTNYCVSGRSFGSHVHAATAEEAARFARARGLGEVVDGGHGSYCHERRASVLLRDERVAAVEKLHALCWVLNLALAAGVASRDETLGDVGVLHEATHCALGYTLTLTWPELADLVAVIETRIPGYCP
jgi:hypothetical protein